MMRRWDYCCGSGDPAIKLFGKRIPLAPMRNDRQQTQTGMEGVDESRTTDELDHNEPPAAIVLDDEEEEEQEEQEEEEELDRAGTNFDEDEGDCFENSKGASSPGSTTKFDKEDQSDNNNDGKDPNSKPKKPDKPVACPRCDSMETKFCYYNNYNINQPRHFCKNCQRYWTSGGTLRNVPVGAGRRKNKHHHHHHHQNSTPPQQQWRQHHQQHQQQHQDPHQQAAAVAMNNFTVKMMQQRYGIQEDEPSSIITSLGASGGIPPSGTKNVNNDFCFGFHFGQQQQQQQNQKQHCSQSSNNSEVTVCGGSSSPTSLQDLSSGNSKMKNPTPCNNIGGKSDDASATAAAAAAAAAAWVFPMGMLGKNVPPAVFPYTHPPVGGIPIWPGSVPPAVAAAAAGQWSMQWAAVAAMAAAANASVNNAAAVAAAASGMSPRGKRPGEAADHGGVWVPKTLRIDDPGDAARSSIWAALGVDRKRDSGIHHDSQQQKIGTINPAAMSRSTSFRESC